ncbi:MAG: hypothetical protein ACKVOU_14995 [Cytophagales bacterium]
MSKNLAISTDMYLEKMKITNKPRILGKKYLRIVEGTPKYESHKTDINNKKPERMDVRLTRLIFLFC